MQARGGHPPSQLLPVLLVLEPVLLLLLRVLLASLQAPARAAKAWGGKQHQQSARACLVL